MLAKIKSSLLIFTFSIFVLGTIIGYGLLYPSNDHIKSISYLQIFDQTALGQSVVDSLTNNDTTTVHTDELGETLYRQGIVSSFKSGPNETSQVAPILPHRSDDKIYSGVLTYSATSPVEIAFLSKINIDNDTLSQIIDQFGKSSPHWIDFASLSIHNLTQTTPQIVGGIQPEYGTSTPYYSASIPFVASGVGFWSPVDKPFLVSYQLSANLVQPEIVNKIDFNDTQ
jgi:hypothetical protein